MYKKREYSGTKFSGTVIEEADRVFAAKARQTGGRSETHILRVGNGHEEWSFDSLAEFLQEYPVRSRYHLYHSIGDNHLHVSSAGRSAEVRVQLGTRDDIEEVFRVFERAASGTMEATSTSAPVTKTRRYYQTRFAPEVVHDAHTAFLGELGPVGGRRQPKRLSVRGRQEGWDLPTLEEFLAEYPKYPYCELYQFVEDYHFTIRVDQSQTDVDVRLAGREQIERVFQVFERAAGRSRIVASPVPVKIFIGHGRDQQWRDLKDHLHEKHGFEVVAYEVGPRAGLGIKEVLEGMLNESSFALLVLTGEDEKSDQQLHARQNVVHEAGLFQGRLGFRRAIVLLEEGVAEFSNISGLNHIPFAKGNIKETFGEVLATINRELSHEAE